MYEVKLTPKSRKRFIATARSRMSARGWNMNDLAKAINRPVSSVTGQGVDELVEYLQIL